MKAGDMKKLLYGMICFVLLVLIPFTSHALIDNFTVTSRTHQQVDLNWDTVAGADHYTIHREIGTSITPSEENRIALVKSEFYKDLALDSSTQYTYIVVARSADGTEIDRTGVRSVITKDTDVIEYEYDDPSSPHKMTKRGRYVFSYDRAGNITGWSGGGYWTKITYNAANMVEKITTSDGSDESYLYDAFGRRVARLINGEVVERFFINGVRMDNNGIHTYFFTPEGRRIAVRDPSGEIFYFHADQTSSTRIVSDENGSDTPAMKISYRPFGSILSKEGSLDEPWLFGGKYRHRDTHISFFEARYYMSEFGRFLQPDSIIPYLPDPQRNNRYAFVSNDPVNRTDPTGHSDGDMSISYDPNLGGAGWYSGMFGFSSDYLYNNFDPIFGPSGLSRSGRPDNTPVSLSFIATSVKLAAARGWRDAYAWQEREYNRICGGYFLTNDAGVLAAVKIANGDDYVVPFGTGNLVLAALPGGKIKGLKFIGLSWREQKIISRSLQTIKLIKEGKDDIEGINNFFKRVENGDVSGATSELLFLGAHHTAPDIGQPGNLVLDRTMDTAHGVLTSLSDMSHINISNPIVKEVNIQLVSSRVDNGVILFELYSDGNTALVSWNPQTETALVLKLSIPPMVFEAFDRAFTIPGNFDRLNGRWPLSF